MIQHVLVPIDFSEHADQALEYAIALGKSLQARLTLLHVLHLTPMIGDILPSTLETYLHAMETEAQQQTQALLDRVHQAGLQGDSVIIQGVPLQSIVDTAGNKDVNLIVIGTHGRTGLTHILMGSVAEKVVRLAPCPVLVTRQHEASPEPRFLVPLDFSADADYALTCAMELAQTRQARLTLLHVLDQPTIGAGERPLPGSYLDEVLAAVDQSMASYLARIRNAGLTGDVVILRGNPLPYILDVAHTHNVDLIVMGTHGRTGFKRVWLGSVAENVARLAPCPVLVTRGPSESPSRVGG